MAKITLREGGDYLRKLETLSRSLQRDVVGPAIYDGAGIVTGEIRKNIDALPTGGGHGTPDKPLPGPPESSKNAMRDALGITRMDQDRDGVWNVKIGFDGYTSVKTKRWPKGQPVQMIARSVESGTSWMTKNPFVRPAVNHTRRAAEKAMASRIEREIKIKMQ